MSTRVSGRMGKLAGLVATVENWPQTLADHLRLAREDYVCRLRNGCRFVVRAGTDDRHMIFETFVDRIYPLQISAGATVVDVGAHIGCVTVWAAKQGARVLSFEPHPVNFAALRRNVELNGLSDVRLFQAAVTGTSQSRPMFLPSDPAHTGRYSLFAGRGEQTIPVPCVSLDDVLRENALDHIDLLKVDVQGSEYELLYAAGADTLARTRTIVVECEETFTEPPEWSVAGMRAYLERHGFETRAWHNVVHAVRRSVV